MGGGAFYKTKVITISPRYILQNNTDRELLFKQVLNTSTIAYLGRKGAPSSRVCAQKRKSHSTGSLDILKNCKLLYRLFLWTQVSLRVQLLLNAQAIEVFVVGLALLVSRLVVDILLISART